MSAPSSEPSSVFSWLPTELIIQILSDDLLGVRDRASISLTCHLFHCINNPILYSQNIRHGKSSCLFWAAKHGRIGTLRRGVEAGGDVNVQGWPVDECAGPESSDEEATGITSLLHVAAKYGQRDAAEWLLDTGADIDAPSYRFCDALVVYWRQFFTPAWRPGWTPLFTALNHEQASTARLLISRKAELTHMHTRKRNLCIPALHVAAANGMASVIEMLSQADDFDVNARDFGGNSALHYASQYWPLAYRKNGHDDAPSSPIPLLLSLGAEIEGVNNLRQSPLIHACWSGNWVAATLLVKAGADPRAECYIQEMQKLVRPLYLATLSRADIARQSGSEPYQDEFAWEAARTDFFHALASAGVSVNGRLTDSQSLDIPILQCVCLDHNYSAAEVLLGVAGADVNATDGLGQTALLGYLRFAGQRLPYASRSNVVADIFALLLASGARLDIPDENGCDALQQALDWFLGGADLAGCLPSLLRLADASNVSEARVEAAISSCCYYEGASAYDGARRQSPEIRVASMLLDFRQMAWGRGRLL